ncbi:MAG: HAD family phosphatase [Butyrivibrio sp.]|nr:HAD family phosphatase [Butyrivibrio sp.]
MIDTIIFDIGNVLAIADWPKVFERIGVPADRFEAVADATVRNPLWHEFDRGSIPDNDIVEQFVAGAPDYEEDIRKIFSNLDKIVEVCDYSSEWIKYYRDRGFHTYILSNFSKAAFEACEDNFDFLKYVEGAVVSYRVKEIKPEISIYERLIRMYDIVPQNAIFIDDLERNIEAARSLGINGVVFKSYEDASRQVEEICKNNR